MASYTASLSAVDKTLVASTVDTVTFDHQCQAVEVLTDGTAKVYFTVDGTVPSVGGQNLYVVPASPVSRTVRCPSGNTVVKVVSSGTPVYSVLEAR